MTREELEQRMIEILPDMGSIFEDEEGRRWRIDSVLYRWLSVGDESDDRGTASFTVVLNLEDPIENLRGLQRHAKSSIPPPVGQSDVCLVRDDVCQWCNRSKGLRHIFGCPILAREEDR